VPGRPWRTWHPKNDCRPGQPKEQQCLVSELLTPYRGSRLRRSSPQQKLSTPLMSCTPRLLTRRTSCAERGNLEMTHTLMWPLWASCWTVGGVALYLLCFYATWRWHWEVTAVLSIIACTFAIMPGALWVADHFSLWWALALITAAVSLSVLPLYIWNGWRAEQFKLEKQAKVIAAEELLRKLGA